MLNERRDIPVQISEKEIIPEILHDRNFFLIQLQFAKKALELIQNEPEIETETLKEFAHFTEENVDFTETIELEHVLTVITTLRRMIGLENDNEEWTKVYLSLKELEDSELQATFVFNKYLSFEKQKSNRETPWEHPEDLNPNKNCIYFHLMDEDGEKILFLHFHNRDKIAIQKHISPLHETRREARMEEIAQIVRYISQNYSNIYEVTSVSWIYNLKKFNKIFPPEFTKRASEHVIVRPNQMRRLDFWGQFVNFDGTTRLSNESDTSKNQPGDHFLQSITQAKTIEELVDSFHYKPLNPRCSIKDFLRFEPYQRYLNR